MDKGVAPFDYPPSIVNLSHEKFNRTISSGYWFVEFYSPLCPHCKRFKDDMAKIGNMAMEKTKAKEALTKNGISFHVGSVNCLTEVQLCAEMEIEYFPMLLLFCQDTAKRSIFDDDRNVEQILKFIDNRDSVCKKAPSDSMSPDKLKIFYLLNQFNKRTVLAADGKVKSLFDSSFNTLTNSMSWLIAFYDVSTSHGKMIEIFFASVCKLLTARIACGHVDPAADPTLAARISKSDRQYLSPSSFHVYSKGRSRQYQGPLKSQSLFEFAMNSAFAKLEFITSNQDLIDYSSNFQVVVLYSFLEKQNNTEEAKAVAHALIYFVYPESMCFLASNASDFSKYGNSIVVYRRGFLEPSILPLQSLLLSSPTVPISSPNNSTDSHSLTKKSEVSIEERIRDFIYSRRFALVPELDDNSAFDIMHPESVFGEGGDETKINMSSEEHSRDVVVLGAFDPYAEAGEMRVLEDVAVETHSRVAWVNGLRFSAYLANRFEIKLGDLPRVIICAPSRKLFFKVRDDKPIEFTKWQILAAVREIREAVWADKPNKFVAQKILPYNTNKRHTSGIAEPMFYLSENSWGAEHPILYWGFLLFAFLAFVYYVYKCLHIRQRMAGYEKTK